MLMPMRTPVVVLLLLGGQALGLQHLRSGDVSSERMYPGANPQQGGDEQGSAFELLGLLANASSMSNETVQVPTTLAADSMHVAMQLQNGTGKKGISRFQSRAQPGPTKITDIKLTQALKTEKIPRKTRNPEKLRKHTRREKEEPLKLGHEQESEGESVSEGNVFQRIWKKTWSIEFIAFHCVGVVFVWVTFCFLEFFLADKEEDERTPAETSVGKPEAFLKLVQDFEKEIERINAENKENKAEVRCWSPKILQSMLPRKKPDEEITLVTDCSVDRLHDLDELCQTWDGIISCAIHLTSENQMKLLSKFHDNVESRGGCRLDVTVWISNVFVEDMRRVHGICHSLLYPGNELRNAAMKNSKTRMVFVCDVESRCSKGAHDVLARFVAERNTGNIAYIVPSFEMREQRGNMVYQLVSEPVPLAKQKLVAFLEMEEVKATNVRCYENGLDNVYTRWKQNSVPLDVYLPSGEHPAILIQRQRSPTFDPLFRGTSDGGVTSYFKEVMCSGFQFQLLPDVFVLYELTARKQTRLEVYKKPSYKALSEAMSLHFQRYLARKYRIEDSYKCMKT